MRLMVQAAQNTTPQNAAIAGRYFQPALSSAALNGAPFFNDRIGEIVSDIADINQCVQVILSTPKGSQPHQPLFGSNVHRYIDWPINVASPHLVREIHVAIRAWEPRIKLISVRVFLSDIAALTAELVWRFIADSQRQITSNLTLAGAP